MRWVLAITASLLMVSIVLLKPAAIHFGYQVSWKRDACLKALTIVEDEGYKLLLRDTSARELGSLGAELTEDCDSAGLAYCLIIPGTDPLVFLKVERG
ncbi:MAG: hypothetical protein BA066_02285 [Candidatus Korarchaeota archaeon NZ13-K]|nr:MAG: hypothetical protein BA066_02285 [Candidatus Korarchaeota archaeon NZ13-K]